MRRLYRASGHTGGVVLLRLVRWLRQHIPYLVLFLCIGEGILAFLCMFSFPPAALALVFIGLLTIAVAPLLGWMLGGLERVLMWVLGVAPQEAPAEDIEL